MFLPLLRLSARQVLGHAPRRPEVCEARGIDIAEAASKTTDEHDNAAKSTDEHADKAAF